MTLTIGSLFSGIGGLELGLERAGMTTVWQVEQSPFCRAVLAKHWPNATRYEDVRHVGRSNLAPVDVICGGFPCQDISVAGLRAGIDGERSGLWREYARIIGELRPRYVVVENVAALLGRGLGRVLGDLAALGYDAEWDCIPAQAVGAPHRRDRLFLVAYPRCSEGGERHGLAVQRRSARAPEQARMGGDVARDVGHADSDNGRARRTGRSHSASARESIAVRALQDMANAERGGLQGRIFGRPESAAVIATAFRRESGRDNGRGAWHAEPNVGRLAHGIPRRLVEWSLAALGNAVVPQVAEVVGRLIVEHEAQSRPRGLRRAG